MTDHTDVHELPNVEGVAHEDNGTVIAFVSSKEREDDLDNGDLVRNQQSVANYETSVVDLGGEVRPLTDRIDEHVSTQKLTTERQRHRPIVSGVSEMLSEKKRSFATNGPLVEVDDTGSNDNEYAADVSSGDICRLSNNHVYANIDRASFGTSVSQPSPVHADSPISGVGEYVGSVPIEDGVSVDAAVRNTDSVAESYNTVRGDVSGVRRDDLSAMKGGQLTICGGARTGYDSAEVLATNVSIRVNYGREKGRVEITDCIATRSMSAGGDSGAPAAYDGELVALNFAGSSKVSILCKLSNVEDQLGVTVRTEAPSEPSPPKEPPKEPPKSPSWEQVSSFSDDQYKYEVRRKQKS